MKNLQMMFGKAYTCISMWLCFGTRILIKTLKDNPLAKVGLPSDDEIEEFATAIRSKYPLMTNCWAAMDGLKLVMQRPGYREGSNVQTLFYNGWTSQHCLSNLFIFSPDRKIRHAYVNCPGSMHDSTMANNSGIYVHLEAIYERTGSQTTLDSAFAAKKTDSLIKTSKDSLDNHGNVLIDLAKLNQAKQVRILSEWGMRGFQGSFPRLYDKFRYEERGERKLQLDCMVLLYNFRASTIGFNQIRTVFMPHLLGEI